MLLKLTSVSQSYLKNKVRGTFIETRRSLFHSAFYRWQHSLGNLFYILSFPSKSIVSLICCDPE